MDKGFAKLLQRDSKAKEAGEGTINALEILSGTEGQTTLQDDQQVVEYVLQEIINDQLYEDQYGDIKGIETRQIYRNIAMLQLLGHPYAELPVEEIVQLMIDKNEELIRVRKENLPERSIPWRVQKRFIRSSWCYGANSVALDQATIMEVSAARIVGSFYARRDEDFHRLITSSVFEHDYRYMDAKSLSDRFGIAVPPYVDEVITQMRDKIGDSIEVCKKHYAGGRSDSQIEKQYLTNFYRFVADLVMLHTYFELEDRPEGAVDWPANFVNEI